MKDFPTDNTPFDEQINNDREARRAQPTHAPIRIGASDPPTPVAPPNTPISPPATTNPTPVPPALADDDVPVLPKQKAPLPVVVGLAMIAGAICVIGASLGIRRMMQPLKPVLPNSATLPSGGTVVMEQPELVIKEPTAVPSGGSSVVTPNAGVPEPTEAIPLEEAEELPPEPKPASRDSSRTEGRDDSRDEKRDEEKKEERKEKKPEETADVYPPSDSHRGRGYEITPPPGFRLRQSGRRTIWQRDDGTQILVETGKAGAGSPRAGWERLDRDLAKRYGDRYRSLGIREGTLGGHPAAIWEFELTGKDGITRRKIDIGIKVGGRGYAVLGAAPKEKFSDVKRDIESAVGSFHVKEQEEPEERKSQDERPRREERSRPVPTVRERIRAPRPTPRPTAAEEIREEPVSPLPQPENTPVRERGY